MGDFLTLFVLALMVGAVALGWRWFKKSMLAIAQRPIPPEKVKKLHPYIEDAEKRTGAWGTTIPERLAAIRKTFDAATATVDARAAYSFKDLAPQGAAEVPGNYESCHLGFHISRSLASMDPKERALLRAVEMLYAAGGMDARTYAHRRRALVWGDGKGAILDFTYHMYNEKHGVRDGVTAVNWYMGRAMLSVAAVASAILGEIHENSPDSAQLESVKQELRDLFDHNSAGSSSSVWLQPAEVPDSIFRRRSDHELFLGTFEDGTPLTFSGDESLFTIAPPGAGKTQCHVFPNLLRWKGPAVVLDVSGDIYEQTSRWRSENVGPVFKFAPLDSSGSHRYSPLSFVRSDSDYIWEDARLLADLMIVPSSASDPFWENEARTLVTAAIAHVAYANPPEMRPMHAVLDVLHGGSAWDAMISGLRMAVDVRVMTQHANSLSGMAEKTRDSVLQTARSSLAAWSGERINRATAGSDWHPTDLRSGTNPTIYIVVRPNEVDAYLSLLRVFIGQHIRILTGGSVPRHSDPPVLFMLDEMPRLKHMPPIDEALNIGRKYKLCLWMFAQSLGQVEEAYKNAQGMVGSCGVRAYMNPSLQDKTAENLAEQIGYRQGPLDSTRTRVVEPAMLAGPQFRDHQIVLGTSSKPAKLVKCFAYSDPELRARMGALEARPEQSKATA